MSLNQSRAQESLQEAYFGSDFDLHTYEPIGIASIRHF